MSEIFKPFDYQARAIQEVICNNEKGLFLGCGLGKSIITLTAINILKYDYFDVDKVLVIAPKKVAESTWSAEIEKWNHTKGLRISKVLGTARQRMEALKIDSDIYIINRENVKWLVDLYGINNWPFDMVVIDELSNFKNHKAQRFRSLISVRPKIKRIIGLTGTPRPNSIEDLFGEIYLLDNGKRLGRFISHFRNNYLIPDKRNGNIVFNYLPKPGAEEAIYDKISDLCISMKTEDYIELPDKINNYIYIELDQQADKKYEQLKNELVLEISDDEEIAALNAASLTNKLLQMCNGAIYKEVDEDGNRGYVDLHNNKIESFLELIESLNGKPVLVFYNYKHDLTRIKEALKKYSNLKVRELKTSRDEVDWNNKNVDVLLAQPKSVAFGLNLQAGGSNIIWFGLTWNSEDYEQANARLYRQGQTEPVYIHHLVVKGKMDERVLKVLNTKDKAQEGLRNALKEEIKRQ